MRFLITILAVLSIYSIVNASELTFKFDSPSFSGEGKSSHYLTVENIEKTRKDAIKAAEKAAADKVIADEKAAAQVALELKKACDKDPNPQGEVSKECTELIDEKDWADIDKETEKVEENTNEENDNGTSDSSSDNN